MNSVFLSYSFSHPRDLRIVGMIEDLLRCFNVWPKTGRHLGGNDLLDEIKKIIDESDALIALASRRDQMEGGGWHTHPWVRDEYGHARTRKLPAIMLIEDGVEIGGGYEGHEYIVFDHDKPDAALLKLAKTLGLWKTQSGKSLRVRLLPEDLSRVADRADCQYQFVERGARLGWQKAEPVTEPGGTFLYLDGVRDGYLIQVRLTHDGRVHESPATDQSMPIELS